MLTESDILWTIADLTEAITGDPEIFTPIDRGDLCSELWPNADGAIRDTLRGAMNTILIRLRDRDLVALTRNTVEINFDGMTEAWS